MLLYLENVTTKKKKASLRIIAQDYTPQISFREIHSFWKSLKNYWIPGVRDSKVSKTETKLLGVSGD